MPRSGSCQYQIVAGHAHNYILHTGDGHLGEVRRASQCRPTQARVEGPVTTAERMRQYVQADIGPNLHRSPNTSNKPLHFNEVNPLKELHTVVALVCC